MFNQIKHCSFCQYSPSQKYRYVKTLENIFIFLWYWGLNQGLSMPVNHSATELYPQPLLFLFLNLETQKIFLYQISNMEYRKELLVYSVSLAQIRWEGLNEWRITMYYSENHQQLERAFQPYRFQIKMIILISYYLLLLIVANAK